MAAQGGDRKSTRLNSSHRCIPYAVFCLKKKKLQGWESHLPVHLLPPALRQEACGIYVHSASHSKSYFFFFNEPATPEIYPLPLPAALPISPPPRFSEVPADAHEPGLVIAHEGGFP